MSVLWKSKTFSGTGTGRLHAARCAVSSTFHPKWTTQDSDFDSISVVQLLAHMLVNDPQTRPKKCIFIDEFVAVDAEIHACERGAHTRGLNFAS